MTAWATVNRTVLPVRLLLMMLLLRGTRHRGRDAGWARSPGTAVQHDGLLLGHLGDRRSRPLLADPAALQPAVRHQVGPPQGGPVDVDVARVDLPYRTDDSDHV